MKSLHIRPYHKADEIKFVKVPKDEADKTSTIKQIAEYGLPVEIDEIGVASIPPFQIETVDGMFPNDTDFMSLTSLKISTYPTQLLMYGAGKNVYTSDLENYKHNQRVFSMIPLMYLAGGVGLAAPQINYDKFMFVMDHNFNPQKEQKITPRIVYNPKIINIDITLFSQSREGCLSVPEVAATMDRYNKLKLEYYTIRDQKAQIEAENFEAVVIQHEVDHLYGMTIHKNLSKLDCIRYSDIAKKYKRR